jgi:hypothetical protein
VLVYAVVDDSLSPTSPLGDSLDVFVRGEDPASSRRSEATSRNSRSICGSRSASLRRGA